MCMSDPVRIESKDVPKYAYKVYRVFSDKNKLETYFRHDIHTINKFNKSDMVKKTYDRIKHISYALHFGRISVYLNKKDAIKFARHSPFFISYAWKVEIKQTTKYAFLGKFNGTSLAVDQVKPIKRVF